MSLQTDELKNRVEARKHELLAKFNELKADTQHGAADAAKKLRAKLDELETTLKDGWSKLTDDVSAKLNKWLDHDGDKDKAAKTPLTPSTP